MTGVGFAQPNANGPCETRNDTAEQHPADRVEVHDRVERQAPEQLGRPVAEPVRGEGMGELVDREPDEQHDRDDDDDRAGARSGPGHLYAVPRMQRATPAATSSTG